MAERRVYTEPISTGVYARLTLEECIYHIYEEHHIELPFNTNLYSLLNHEEIKAIIPSRQQNGIKIIRGVGNTASHVSRRRVDSTDTERAIRYSFDFLKWFANNYCDTPPTLPRRFDLSLVPKVGDQKRKKQEQLKEWKTAEAKLQARIEQLQKANAAALEKAQESEIALAAYEAQQAKDKAALEAKIQSRHQPLSSEYNEAETREHLIDAALKEAGWSALQAGRDLEFPVKGMPITADNPKGNGFVDYVLWDDNGKPLALIEAKRTSKNVEVGKHQAFLYANCLEKMYGQRPIIFYSNGFETKIWEDQFYSAPRRVYGFYTKEELQWKIQQRQTRKDIRKATVNAEIAGRPYQMEAIQRVAESFIVDSQDGWRGDQRNVLLVMATGSGKTRTSAALVEILLNQNWAKRILFLADRNALVRQAQKNFGKHLSEVTSIDLTKEKEDNTTRLVFSTYPSMMNKIDSARTEDERFYGVGHFDLIIVDEAHRSVYNRYQAIFEYFDAMIVGLTATPKDSIDHNTFELFGCPTDDPTFDYPLEKAIPQYLNDYQPFDVKTKFLREGIKYSELTEAEKKKYEATFSDKTTGLFPEEIPANSMNKWLFNKDTCYKVLDTLMEEGLKIEGGDKIGRTIIFAVNQKHAQFIVECFQERYPQYSGDFIAMIHNKVSHAQSLIDDFCDEYKEKNPQIAVSVDMMDTGIDAPRILNLIFFKVVRSYAKFWQMIGRGTRLCPDVFGPDQPKKEFYIFDVCQNFDFFDLNKKGKATKFSKGVSPQIFEARLQLTRLLAETGDVENVGLANELLDILHQSISTLDKDRFQVQMHLQYVDEFKERSRWNNLSAEDVHHIQDHLSSLPIPEKVDERTRRFDLMMLKLQIAELLELRSKEKFQNNLMNIGELLSKKYTIGDVLKATETIEKLKDPNFYEALSQKRLDEIRQEIRDLMKYLEAQKVSPIYSNIEDSEATVGVREKPEPTYNSGMYQKRVERFLRENKNQITIYKLRKNEPITNGELKQLEVLLFHKNELGSKEDFQTQYGEQPLGKFIRSILGLEIETANQAFADFLQTGSMSADQMTFIQNIITYLTKNGTIDKRMLFQAPFTDSHDEGLIGIFDEAQVGKIVSIIDQINDNAEVG